MSWLDALLGGIKSIFEAGSPKPLREGLNFASGFTVTDNPTESRLDISVSGTSPYNAPPASVGTAAAGASALYARGDHVHAHGNQAGGSLHANAIASGAAGFQSGADKAAHDANTADLAAATSAATPGALARRAAVTGALAAGPLTAPSLIPASGGLTLGDASQATDINATAINETASGDINLTPSGVLRLGANSGSVATASQAQLYSVGLIQLFAPDSYVNSGNLILRTAAAAEKCRAVIANAFLWTYDSTVTSIVDSITKRGGTGANNGAARSITAQDGQNVAAGTNNSGGNLVMRSGAVGTGGTGGSNGSVTIGTGALDRIQCTGTDIGINANGTLILTGSQTISGDLTTEGQVSTPEDVLAFAGTNPTFDARNGNYHRFGTLTGNVTGMNLSNAVNGSIHVIEVVQDATGGRTLTWNANFKFGASYSDVAFGDALARTIWTFLAKSATDIRCIGRETYTT